MAEIGHTLEEVGISGYPETHPLISDETTIRAMYDKAPYATYIVSQICVDPAVTAHWIRRVRNRGVELPIHIGIPGVVNTTKLMRRSEEHTSELQSRQYLVCRLLLEKKKKK